MVIQVTYHVSRAGAQTWVLKRVMLVVSGSLPERAFDPLHAIGLFLLRWRLLVTAGGLIIGLSIRWRPGATTRNRRRC